MRTRNLDEAIDAVSKVQWPAHGRAHGPGREPAPSRRRVIRIVAAFGRAILPRTCKYRRLEFSAPVSHDSLRALALPPDVSCVHVRGRIAPGRYC
jgi:hypothetical protein